MKMIPYPSDMNAIEIAVWAAEFVRWRATISMASDQSLESEITGTIVSANCAVADLRRARSAQEAADRIARESVRAKKEEK